MTKHKWKDGDHARVYIPGHDQREEVDGTIHRMPAFPDQWWFIPEGGRVIDGQFLKEKDLHEP